MHAYWGRICFEGTLKFTIQQGFFLPQSHILWLPSLPKHALLLLTKHCLMMCWAETQVSGTDAYTMIEPNALLQLS
jgi:hypothetical protein